MGRKRTLADDLLEMATAAPAAGWSCILTCTSFAISSDGIAEAHAFQNGRVKKSFSPSQPETEDTLHVQITSCHLLND